MWPAGWVLHKLTRLGLPSVVPAPPDPPFTEADLVRWAERYCAFHEFIAAGHADRAPRHLVEEFNEINEWARKDPERLWPIVTTMVDRAPSEAVLWYVAAGPLEDLVSYHGPHFLDRLEDRARVNLRFRDALRGVWGWQRFPRVMRDRLYPILMSDLDQSELQEDTAARLEAGPAGDPGQSGAMSRRA
jgi:hypothetical protein